MSNPKLDNTKLGVREVLKKLLERSDSFVDAVAGRFPEQFEPQAGEKEDSMIDPFVLIGLMNAELEMRFHDALNSGKLVKKESKINPAKVFSFDPDTFDSDDDGNNGSLQ